MSEATATLLAAGVAAVASVVVALMSVWSLGRTHRNSADLARLTAHLDERKSVEAARRDYTYDALKRLYAECGPLLFEVQESADVARRRVLSLARTSRDGHLRDDRTGWLASEGYYFESTAYRLLAPLATFRILQRRLTSLDLTVEPRLGLQYQLLRLLYRSFTDDHDLARVEPRLPYDPDAADEGRAGPAHARQGLYRGTLDRLVDGLIVEDGGRERTVTFGEFVEARETGGPRAELQRRALRGLLLGFAPQRRPVLWRVLVSQALLYEALRASTTVDVDHVAVTDLLPERLVAELAELDCPDDPGLAGTVRAAWTHLTRELEQARGVGPPTGGPARGTPASPAAPAGRARSLPAPRAAPAGTG